jgi:hypothetical protein
VPAANAATMEDAVRVESEVVLYSSLNNEQIVTLIDAFKKKYPFIEQLKSFKSIFNGLHDWNVFNGLNIVNG